MTSLWGMAEQAEAGDMWVRTQIIGSLAGQTLTLTLPSSVPRPFLYGRGEKDEERKGLVNNSTPTKDMAKINQLRKGFKH